mgnify:CR=1 FL=1
MIFAASWTLGVRFQWLGVPKVPLTHLVCTRSGYRAVDPATGVPIVWKMMTPLYGQGDAGLVWFRTIKNQ